MERRMWEYKPAIYQGDDSWKIIGNHRCELANVIQDKQSLHRWLVKTRKRLSIYVLLYFAGV